MRPLAEVLATDAGGARKKISRLVDGIENGAKISGSPRRQRRVKRKEKKISQGVDGSEICCKMCGSLGRFGGRGAEREKALRPIPTIFDSVRR
jgi:hypothetical protein